jgi:hypothetical protein
MNKIYYRLFFVSLLLVGILSPSTVLASIHSFVENSVLSNGKFVKIRVKESGVYRLTFEDLNAMGINPSNVRVFGYGGGILSQSFLAPKIDDLPEVAIHMEKGADGVFNAGDYILFYAQGPVLWNYDTNRAMFVHQPHLYSNYGHYFISSDAGVGRRIETMPEVPVDELVINEITTFTDYAVHEKDLQSLANSGKVFYGETFSDVLSMNINFNFPGLVKEANSVKARLDVAASSVEVSDFRLTLDGEQEKRLQISARSRNDNYEKGRDANGTFTFDPSDDKLVFGLRYTRTAPTGRGFLNYLAVNVKRQLTMHQSWMRFQNTEYLGSESINRFNIANTGSNVEVWDITNPVHTTRMNTIREGNNLRFTAPARDVRVYVALDTKSGSSFPKPEVVGNVPNQNLHGMGFVDMLIITHPNFLQQARRLADAHNAKGEIKVSVVTTEQVYNEFSSGNPDATAYRWVMKMFYDRANALNDTSLRPKNLLLFGRGSFDNRNLLFSTGESFVLTYQTEQSLSETLSYVSDDYFTFLEDHEGLRVDAHTMDIGVGRFPVTTVKEANDVVNKTIAYMQNTNLGIWKNQLCYLADDGDGALHMRDADSVAVRVARNHPSYQITKIYLDAYQQIVNASGETYPMARTQFHNMLRKGMLFLNYVGHAGITGWTNEQILTIADVKTLSNKNLPLWVAATCDFLQFDNITVSAGEHVVLNPVGGGIAIISAARPVYASQNKHINMMINHFLFLKEDGKHLRLGEILRRAKNSLGTEINKLSYILVGDPSLRLNYPDEYQVVASQLNGREIAGNDTLRALSVNVLRGYIADVDGNVNTTFNGEVHAELFDKIQRIRTLNNDSTGDMTYFDRPHKLFSGVAEVVNGEFEISFIIPRDIRYNFGTGRMNFYAADASTLSEAQGSLERFYIGGLDDNFIYETDGPEIRMYLNTPDFQSGDQTNETPLFVADVSDISGINQVGSGIGHDITLIINDDPGMYYVLNDHYTSAMNDFTRGQVRFKIPELRSGKHTLTFRVWDMLNNSSTQTLDFEVVRGLEPVIYRIYNYPNPVTTSTNFVIEHDRPETVISAQVDVFDVSGRRVWTFQQATLDKIFWDASDSFGRQLPKGVYLYRISINTMKGRVESKLNKFILTE